MKDTTRPKSPQLDRLIAQSKQVTNDLIVLRSEMARTAPRLRPSYRQSPVTMRTDLLVEQLNSMRDEMWKLWEQSLGFKESEPKSEPVSHIAPRRIGQGNLLLTGGN